MYCVKSPQLCLTLCDPMDCSPPGSSAHGISQARILEWAAMPSSRGSSCPRDWIWGSYVSCTGRQVLYHQCPLWRRHVQEEHFMLIFLKFYFIFKFYIIVLVLPNIKMSPPQVYMCYPSWTLLPPPSPYPPSGFQSKFLIFQSNLQSRRFAREYVTSLHSFDKLILILAVKLSRRLKKVTGKFHSWWLSLKSQLLLCLSTWLNAVLPVHMDCYYKWSLRKMYIQNLACNYFAWQWCKM